MTTENDHLTQLRASLEEMEQEPGRDPAADKAIKVLLRVAIAHHEAAADLQIAPGAVVEPLSAFMESGESPPVPATV